MEPCAVAPIKIWALLSTLRYLSNQLLNRLHGLISEGFGIFDTSLNLLSVIYHDCPSSHPSILPHKYFRLCSRFDKVVFHVTFLIKSIKFAFSGFIF